MTLCVPSKFSSTAYNDEPSFVIEMIQNVEGFKQAYEVSKYLRLIP